MNASMRGSSSASTQALVLEPTTEIADEPKLAHHRWAGVSLCLADSLEVEMENGDVAPWAASLSAFREGALVVVKHLEGW